MICEHGSVKRKCPICELIAAEAEIERYRKALEQIKEASACGSTGCWKIAKEALDG